MNLFRRIFDRRSNSGLGENERRKPSLKEIDQRFDNALGEFERTVMGMKAIPINDIQNVVIFSTFAERCEYRLVTPQFKVCKHREHEGFGTGVAPCAEGACPFMRGTAK